MPASRLRRRDTALRVDSQLPLGERHCSARRLPATLRRRMTRLCASTPGYPKDDTDTALRVDSRLPLGTYRHCSARRLPATLRCYRHCSARRLPATLVSMPTLLCAECSMLPGRGYPAVHIPLLLPWVMHVPAAHLSVRHPGYTSVRPSLLPDLSTASRDVPKAR